MKTRIVLALALLAAGSAHAGDQLSPGIGLGGSYSGIGINLALRGDDDLKYVSLGCTSIWHDSSTGTHAACGPGAGWWKAGLIGDNDRHAFGLYFGAVGDRDSGNRGLKTLYGVGVGYNYYFKGINRAGFNLGLMPTLGREAGDNHAGLLLGFGYQF